MIDVKPLGAFFECHQRRRREHTDLSHAAAEHLTDHSTTLDESFRADDHRSHRRAETFAKAELHRIAVFGYFADLLSQIHRRVEDPRAVEMNFQAGFVSFVADRL